MHPQGLVRALLIALLYPILLMMLVWVFTGESSIGGSESILLTQQWLVLRVGIAVMIVFWFCSVIFLCRKATELSSRVSVYWLLLLVFVMLLGLSIEVFVNFFTGILIVIIIISIFGFNSDSSGVAAGVMTTVAVTITFAYVNINPDIDNFSLINVFAVNIFVVIVFAVVFKYFTQNGFAWPLYKQSIAPMLLLFLAMNVIIVPSDMFMFSGVEKHTLWVQRELFAAVFFMTVLPILNSIADWVSVSVTQNFMRSLGAKKHGKVQSARWLILQDLFCAAMLAVVLLLVVVFVIHLMAQAGWGVDPAKVVKESSVWLGLMVLTNLAPTLLHLRCALLGWGSGRYLKADKNIDDYEKTLKADGKLKSNQAQDLARYLYTYPVTAPLWLAGGALVVSLLTIQGVVSLLRWVMVTFA